MVDIVPAILTDSSLKFKELVRKLEPYTDRIHLDIADGIFVPNKTVAGYEELKEIKLTIKFDVHLMVAKPQDYLEKWFNAQVDRFIVNAESEGDLGKIIKNIKEHDRKVGIALNPETGFEKIESYLHDIDLVQFMTVHPGFQGGEFVSEVVDKIVSFHRKYPDIMIMCDGGITPETAPRLVKAGASVLVSGSYIVNSEDAGEVIEQLKKVTSD